MSNYKKLLLAVDFTTHDDFVSQRAGALAQQLNAELSLIHVLDNIPMPDTPYGTIIPLNEDTQYALLEGEKKKLTQLGKQLDIPLENCWLIWGEPREEIAQLAKREQIDLIVVGSHGRHGLAVLLGSTATGVLFHTNCDVLAVHLNDASMNRTT